MAHFADPNRCPSCSGPILGPVCPTCGLRLVGETAGELFRTLQYADTLLERLRTEPVEAPAPGAIAPQPATAAATPPAVPSVATPPRRRWTVPAVLLTLGGISLASGAVIFLAIAWFLLGVGGRTVALALVTGGLGAATPLALRRGLRAAGETLGTLSAVFAAFDLIGVRLAWYDDVSLRGYSIGAGLLLAVVCAGGVLALRTRARLWGPEAVGAVGLTVAAVAGLATDDHMPLAAGIVMVVGAVAAWVTRRLRLPVLSVDALVLAAIGWLLLVIHGVGTALTGDHAAWSTIGPLAVAGAAAIAVAALVRPGRPVAATVGVWLLVGAAVGWTGWFHDIRWSLLVVAAVALVGYVAPRRGWGGAGLGVGLSGTVVVLVVAAGWILELADAVLDVTIAHGWSTRFAADHTVPSWSAIAGFVLVAALAQRTRGMGRHPSLASGAAVAIGLTAAGPVDRTLLLAATALVAALMEGVIAQRRSHWHGAAALVLGALAALLALASPAAESVVWWAAAVQGVVVLLRGRGRGRMIASGLTTPCLGVALLLDGDALGAEMTWVGVAAIVVVFGAALALRGRAVWPELAGGTLVAMLGAAAIGAAAAGSPANWLAGELTLLAAACAIAGVLERSRAAGVAAGALGLVALWLRLGAGGVHTPEAYTLPLAAVVLLVGARAMRGDLTRRTVPTIGTGIALALVPTWALGVTHPLGVRALLAGLACVALVAAGARLRWMAPLLLGAVAGAVLALVEVAPYADAVPRWALLVAIGVSLLAAGVRWESLATAGRRTWGRLADLR